MCVSSPFNKLHTLLHSWDTPVSWSWSAESIKSQEGEWVSTSCFKVVSKAPYRAITVSIMWMPVTYLQRDVYKWQAWIPFIYDSVLEQDFNNFTFSSTEDVKHVFMGDHVHLLVCVFVFRGWWWCLQSWRRLLAASWRVVSPACGWRSPTPASNHWEAMSMTSLSGSSSYRYWSLP